MARDSRQPAPRTGEVSYWHRSLGGPPRPRDPLPGPISADIAIVGAGYTGLWTAYYLKRADPSLNVVVLEARFAGFGASGRNGGWVMGACEGRPARYAKRGGAEGVIELQRQLKLTVSEIEDVLVAEEIDADFVRSGALTVAIGEAQEKRLRASASSMAEDLLDGREDDVLLESDELNQRLRIADARGAIFSPHVARVHPVKLLRGLAEAVEALDVKIYESTPVGEIGPHLAVTERGSVKADWVVRATEGYTASLRGLRTALVPINSSMIATEPLSAEMWDEIGWQGQEVIGDEANLYFYMQRTADGRIAIGGRGAPYRFGSATDFGGEIAPETITALYAKLNSMFPALAGVGVAHGWSGVIGVPRDWCVGVNADQQTGLAWAGGYSGEGVAATNLAGRMLRDLLLGRDSELTTLPWAGREPARWEPEPFRYAAIRSMYAGFGYADRIEQRSGKPAALARALNWASGR